MLASTASGAAAASLDRPWQGLDLLVRLAFPPRGDALRHEKVGVAAVLEAAAAIPGGGIFSELVKVRVCTGTVGLVNLCFLTRMASQVLKVAAPTPTWRGKQSRSPTDRTALTARNDPVERHGLQLQEVRGNESVWQSSPWRLMGARAGGRCLC
jgi:hypothetical protein